MPWMTLPFEDPRAESLRAKFGVVGVPALIILDAVTGFTVTPTARKDLSKDVKDVYESWAKLLDLKKQKAIERSQEDAISKAQHNERAWREK